MNDEEMEVTEGKSWEDSLDTELWTPPVVDIYETETDYFISASMPGVTKDNVRVKVEKANLIIMGRINYDEIQNRKFLLKESRTANYYRSFKLSESVNEKNVDATFEDGQLLVKIPKYHKSKPRSIEIKFL
ncbi:MAG: Hsp20/alpha crystallin family protein [bacterium]